MFEPNRSLLNPKFEGYKLDALDQDEIISRFPLQYKLSQTTLSGRTPLSFQEVQSRIRHNHLTIGPGNRAAYVDVDFRVITVTVDEATPIPSFEVVYELPRPIQTSAQDVPQREYPSTAFLTAEVLLVSDGYGSLYAVNLVKSTPNQLLGTFDFLVPDVYESSKRNVPFRLHLAQQTSSDTAILILSSKYYTNETASSISAAEQQPKRANRLSNVKFDIWAVKLTQDTVSQDQILPLDIVWHRRGEDVPQFIMHDASRQAFMLLSSCPYGSIDTAPSSVYEPTSDDMAPILRAGENLNGDSGVVTPLQAPSPPPYSWMQSSDSVTIAFPLPSSTPKSAIRVTFTPRTLTVLVAAETLSPSVVIPKYAAKTLWDGIQPSTSFWTWDKEDNHSFGVLTLHLDKQHEGTRWSQVFAKAGTQPSTSSNSPDDVEVPETLDPSELYNIRESLEKYTAALQSGAKGGIPSLAEGEMDEEIDSEMGKWSFATWVHEDGREPSWSDERGMDAPLSLLSTPLPGVEESTQSMVLKNSVDGVVFTLQDGSLPTDAPAWKHTFTFPALSFVLASKRDTRFIHHVSSKAVLAFESGSQGNVYMYRSTTGVHDKWAKQAVLKISGGMGGSLLGVGLLKTSQGKPLILGLCEGELVVAYDVL